MATTVRRAMTRDVGVIRSLVDHYAAAHILLDKATVALYEDVQEFWIADLGGRPVGCGALHVMWEDLAEVRTIAVDPAYRGKGIGKALLDRLIDVAREVGVRRVFVLTFEVEFFTRNGFRPIAGTPVPHDVYAELLRSYDEGVAEFLGLERVKPNTLGNTRMLREL
ncbi:MAG: amino-acid N-acetyltransferase [Mycobacteriales bacterium]